MATCLWFGPAESAKGVNNIDGAKIYKKNCAVCHGDKGDGNSRAAAGLRTKPRNFTSKDIIKTLTRERMIQSVRTGIDGSPMVSWDERLGIDTIEKVVDYIRMTFMGKKGEKNVSLASVRRKMAKPMVKGLVGDPVKGAEFFNNNCYVCHGKKGEGNGPRSKFINPKPRNFRLLASRIKYNRPTLFESISKGIIGSEMPSWNKVLTDQQIADVAEYVFQKFIQPKKLSEKVSGS